MIVAISGSHSTGKSTLVKQFKGNKQFVCIDSVTRSTITAAERRIDGVEDLDKSQLTMMENISDMMEKIVEMDIAKSDRVYLLDRSVFDFLAYSRCFAKRGLITEDTLAKIEATCGNLCKYIDLVGYLDIEFDTVDDGIRSLDEELRKDVNVEIFKELLWSKCRVIKLTGLVDVRVDNLLGAINDARNKRQI